VSKKDGNTGSTASAVNKLGIDQEQLEEARLLEHPSYVDLQKRLTEAEEKATQNWERVLRIQAEMDNMQRRVERDIANAHKFALEKFVMELLPVIDNLERALEHHGDEEGGEGSVLEGVALTLKMLVDVMTKFGVEQINPVSQAFNPELHQAVSAQLDPSVKSGTVLHVMQKGYLLNGRLIRPALVMVSKSTA
jgi:molecular chaperone GrpE